MDDISIRTLDLSDLELRKKWDEFVFKFEHGHHHSTNYLDAIFDAYSQHENHSLVALDSDGEVIGALPLVGQRSLIWGNSLTSTPFFNYGGALFFDSKIEQPLLEEAAKVMRCEGYKKLEVRSMSPLENQDELRFDGWHTHTHKVAMTIKLSESIESLGSGKKWTKLKSQCKRAEREALKTNSELKQLFGKEELLNDFYSVFSKNMRDLGTPVYGIDFFRSMLAQIDSILTVVYWEGKPVSCGFLFKHETSKGLKYSIPWASSLSEYSKISVNLYMYYNILDFVINGGAIEFDFGRSTIDSGTYKFKKQWGAEPQTCHWHQLLIDESESEPRLDTSQGKMKYVIEAWKRLPLPIANLLGPHIVKSIP